MTNRFILLLILLISICICAFSDEDITLPNTINFKINDDINILKKIDSRIFYFQIINIDNDKKNDLLIIFKISKSDETFFFVYAIYENKNNQFSISNTFIDKDSRNEYFNGIYLWGKSNTNNIEGKSIIDLSDYDIESTMFSREYLRIPFFNNHFIIAFAYPDYEDFWIMNIINKKILPFQRIGSLRYQIEDQKNIYFISRHSFYDSDFYSTAYLRTYLCYTYNKNSNTIKENALESPDIINIIYKYNLDIFSQEKTIDSLFELFFFTFYNNRNILTKEWLNKMLEKVDNKNDRYIKIKEIIIKRIDSNDIEFYDFYSNYSGPWPKIKE